MQDIRNMSTLKNDFVASHLRSQINRLNSLLGNIEDENRVDRDYARKSLKEIEIDLRQIRKLCVTN